MSIALDYERAARLREKLNTIAREMGYRIETIDVLEHLDREPELMVRIVQCRAAIRVPDHNHPGTYRELLS